jgi:hypothetical protein
VAVYTFPASSFTVEGDPEAIRTTGRSYGSFATTAAASSADIRSLDSTTWEGSEADAFREGLNHLPPHLDTAHTAFSQVASALATFADELDNAQAKMRGVSADAQASFTQLTGARSEQAKLRPPTEDELAADPALLDTFETRRTELSAQVADLGHTFDGYLSTAVGLRALVDEAAARAGRQIRTAGTTSPTHDQNWFADKLEKAGNWIDENLAGLRDWIGEHAGILRTIAKGMRIVGIALVGIGAALAALSAVAGFFSFGIGWLGELPAGGIMTAGFALWGGADALDKAVDWGERKIDGRQLIVEGSLAAATSFPAGRVIKIGDKAIRDFGPAVAKKAREWGESAIESLGRKLDEAKGDEHGGFRHPGAPKGPLVLDRQTLALADRVGCGAEITTLAESGHYMGTNKSLRVKLEDIAREFEGQRAAIRTGTMAELQEVVRRAELGHNVAWEEHGQWKGDVIDFHEEEVVQMKVVSSDKADKVASNLGEAARQFGDAPPGYHRVIVVRIGNEANPLGGMDRSQLRDELQKWAYSFSLTGVKEVHIVNASGSSYRFDPAELDLNP